MSCAAADALDGGSAVASRGVEELAGSLATLAAAPLPGADQTLRGVRERIAAAILAAAEEPFAQLVLMVGRDILLILPSGTQ